MTLSLDRQNSYRALYRVRHPEWRPATEVYESVIRQHLRPGMRVLDLGCGRGGVLEQLGAIVTRPLGFDPDLLSLREHRLSGLQRSQALADALPLRDSVISVSIWCCAVG
jgi:ubiquinone/menaquinone biosynthesis C-methylase UbiE